MGHNRPTCTIAHVHGTQDCQKSDTFTVKTNHDLMLRAKGNYNDSIKYLCFGHTHSGTPPLPSPLPPLSSPSSSRDPLSPRPSPPLSFTPSLLSLFSFLSLSPSLSSLSSPFSFFASYPFFSLSSPFSYLLIPSSARSEEIKRGKR